MRLKIFVKEDCPKCPAAKEVAKQFKGPVEVFDIEHFEGLAEAAFYGVQCTPSILLIDDGGRELKAWRCEVPSPKEIEVLVN